jgi:hypothetical protein
MLPWISKAVVITIQTMMQLPTSDSAHFFFRICIELFYRLSVILPNSYVLYDKSFRSSFSVCIWDTLNFHTNSETFCLNIYLINIIATLYVYMYVEAFYQMNHFLDMNQFERFFNQDCTKT